MLKQKIHRTNSFLTLHIDYDTLCLQYGFGQVKGEEHMKYTLTNVKFQLPKVKIQVGGKVYEGKLMGRQNRFATVYVRELGGATYEYAWSTVVNTLNSGRTLLT